MGIIDYSQTIDVLDQSKVDPNGLLSPYIKDGIMPTLDSIFINGRQFKGIGRDSSLGWEEFVWGEEPTRSKTFAFENMDDIDVGLVAQCEVSFKYSNIQDFMAFRDAIKQRYFQVIFFNVDTSKWTQREMYCSKKERGKLHFFNPKLLGVLDLSVTLVATNRDQAEQPNIEITYTNGDMFPFALSNEIKENIKYSTQYTVANPPLSLNRPNNKCIGWTTARSQRHGEGWEYIYSPNTIFNEVLQLDGTTKIETYPPAPSFTAFKNTTLYPLYEKEE